MQRGECWSHQISYFQNTKYLVKGVASLPKLLAAFLHFIHFKPQIRQLPRTFDVCQSAGRKLAGSHESVLCKQGFAPAPPQGQV